ncbi:hypothetical protein [Paeniglutamicibacter psychrophenolicus]|uniref:hypothetical protein n=1 Tax=Paeniglutamicibacter psychrophenolicus TaxID=257454 RepID=UPI00278A7549|nr:hypothetical protein [Paeniglutamicibacter psychrophenolicus]MDQ0096078.1 hypothetical protein [Paeniglutamicibacter psychrophenolicus]
MAHTNSGQESAAVPPEKPAGHETLDSFDPLRDAETLLTDEDTQAAADHVPQEPAVEESAGQDSASTSGTEDGRRQDRG